MNLKEKAAVITSLAKGWDVFPRSQEERKELLDGASILLDLDWPSNYIDVKKCRRANQGLVPRYDGLSSLADYVKRWWSEDHK
jgi:hypothetical protein